MGSALIGSGMTADAADNVASGGGARCGDAAAAFERRSVLHGRFGEHHDVVVVASLVIVAVIVVTLRRNLGARVCLHRRRTNGSVHGFDFVEIGIVPRGTQELRCWWCLIDGRGAIEAELGTIDCRPFVGAGVVARSLRGAKGSNDVIDDASLTSQPFTAPVVVVVVAEVFVVLVAVVTPSSVLAGATARGSRGEAPTGEEFPRRGRRQLNGSNATTGSTSCCTFSCPSQNAFALSFDEAGACQRLTA